MTDKYPLPPGPGHWTAWRLGLAFHRDPLRLFLELPRDHGDIVHAGLGQFHIVLVTHPDLVEQVLVTHARDFTKEHGPARQVIGNGLLVSDGDFHLRQRRMMQPAFHRDRIAVYGGVMADFSRRRRDRWHDGQQVSVHHEMTQLTQLVVAKTLFDTDVEAEADAIGAALTTAMQTIFLFPHMPFAGLVKRLRRRSAHRFDEAMALIDRTLYRMIDEHRKGGRDRGDLLSMLLAAQDTEGGTGGMTDEQVRDELATLYVAGHETSANALTWVWTLLARHPEAEATLHAELDQVLAGRPPTVADVPHLPYTEMVVAESLRLYPPVWTYLRQAIHDTTIGDYSVPAGTAVFVNTYGIHHDARFFPNPGHFDPQRMTRAARAARPRFAFFPFSGGTRQCMGESFAWTEMILVVATIAQRWRLRLAPGQTVVPNAGLTLRAKGEVPMIVEARK
ncbi:MAG: cytochrome P450 [Gemmataceae bacterium]|nr:cytochrome P450 [Gemmataceae bacterium]